MSAKPCIDHNGNSYPSLKDMCDAHGVLLNTYKTRKKAGKSLEQCLAPPPVYTDPAGNTYDSLSALSRASGIPYDTLRSRMRRGLPIEECLKHTEKQEEWKAQRARKITDHLGNEYPSLGAMCRHYGVKPNTYTLRIKSGWTVKDALTRKTHPRSHVQKDHTGSTYPSREAMCRAYNIRPETYIYRIRNGWSVEEALTVPLHQRRKRCEEDKTGPVQKRTDSK